MPVWVVRASSYSIQRRLKKEYLEVSPRNWDQALSRLKSFLKVRDGKWDKLRQYNYRSKMNGAHAIATTGLSTMAPYLSLCRHI